MSFFNTKSPAKPPAESFPSDVKILIIKMSSLGDVIHALPSLAALRSLFPQAVIHWLVEEVYRDLLPGPPWLDKVIYFPKKELKTFRLWKSIGVLKRFRRELRANHYDLVLDLQGLAKSALAAWLSGGTRKLGYWEMREGSFLVSQGIKGPHAQDHVIERYLDVIRYLGPIKEELIYPLPDYSAQKALFQEKLHSLGVRKPVVLFFPGASWPTKLWPAEYYARLAGRLFHRGYDLVLGGGEGEKQLTKDIEYLAPDLPLANLAGQTDLKGLMGLASLAEAVVGSDSGPLHVAAAAGVPTVTLFGPNSSHRTGTYGPRAVNIMSPSECAPCFKKICPRDFVCMSEITVEEVMLTLGRTLHF
jgi:heptosyltransferase-1/heptosyltransferase-2